MQKLLLPVCWVLALIGVFTLSSSFSDKSEHFFGIAGEREQTINFQYPVEVVQFFVVEGKEVQQGQDILEVKRHELDSDLSSINQEIRQYQLQKQETENTINSQLINLEAKKQAVIADMDYQIHVLELRLKMNSEMIQSISGKSDKNILARSTELNDLKRKLHFSVQAIQAEIDGLTEQLNATNRPIDAQINELLTRKEELQRQSTGLMVKAQFNGRIGSVNFKAGELVSPFQSIMSVHSRIPRYIKGYINENILNDVKVGQTVWVSSIAFNKNKSPLAGIVESLGNRIVEYPERLKKNQLVPAWGREVVVRLNNAKNTLLFGEKVQVLLEHPDHGIKGLSAINNANATVLKNTERPSAQIIQSKDPGIKVTGIEASGILWNPNTSQYLLLSDEQYNQQTGVFIMDEKNRISARLPIQPFDKQGVDDLESISSDGDYVYILSSLSHTKKDLLKNKRKKLIRFKYQKQQVIQQQQIDLYKILGLIKDAQTTDPKLALFLKKAIENHSLDIESHFVKNNKLYLGFKSPFATSNQALIIQLHDVEALFEGKVPQAEIWQRIALVDPETGEPMQLSDMIRVDDDLFLLSVSRLSEQKSVLWRYQLKDKILEKIQLFSNLKAEGITYLREQSLFTVVFDEGKNKPSKYLSLPFSVSN